MDMKEFLIRKNIIMKLPALMKNLCVLSAALLLSTASRCWSNDLNIENIGIAGQDIRANTITVEFDLSWKNSWRNINTNFDAVWIFFKYYDYNNRMWRHAGLNGIGVNPSGYSTGSAGSGLEIIVPDDRMGCFIERSSDGTGDITSTNVRVVWQYGSQINDNTALNIAPIRVFAVEMVYVPFGDFYIGDGNTREESIRSFHEAGADKDNLSVQITQDPKMITWDDSTAEIIIDGDEGLTYTSDRLTVPSWPIGYKGFYVMKYEISQEQYADFLNCLTTAQMQSHVAVTVNGIYTVNQSNNTWTYALTGTQTAASFRQIIQPICTYKFTAANFNTLFNCNYSTDASWFNGTGFVPGLINYINLHWGSNQPNDGLGIACNYLLPQDILAYADWAGLRPMTELEYEKACRGSGEPVYQEYTWGTCYKTNALTIENGGESGEIVFEHSLDGEHGMLVENTADAGPGPLRNGYAAGSDTTRIQAGASCWGIMELSGNLGEWVVSIEHEGMNGLIHGDGHLQRDGYSDVSSWPGFGDGAASVKGMGRRGTGDMRVSDRSTMSSVGDRNNCHNLGGRCVRSAGHVLTTPGFFLDDGTSQGGDGSISTGTQTGSSSGTNTNTGTSTNSAAVSSTKTLSSTSSGTMSKTDTVTAMI